MRLEKYLESTFLKTRKESSLSHQDLCSIIQDLVEEAIEYNFKLVMIRPDYIEFANKIILANNSQLLLGTVIDFPNGDESTENKVKEALLVMQNNISDLDFVCDYNAFKRKEFEKFDNDIIEASRVCINSNKTIKWIIETGALSKKQIFDISQRIAFIINRNFKKNKDDFFIKTSTGYYKSLGAKASDIKLIKKAAVDIKIKASGGIKNTEDCLRMIEAGAIRIGTSSALNIYQNT